MTLGTRIDSTLGVITSKDSSGLSIERGSGNAGFGPFKVDAVQALTGSTTLVASDAGVNTISGSGVLTQVLPLASAVPGATFIFRSLSANAHVITSSQETAGTTALVSGTLAGAKLTMAATVGASVVLVCDGVHFMVVGNYLNNPVS